MNPLLETPVEDQARGKEKENQYEKKEAPRLNPKRIHWDYPNPLKDDLWRARRMAEFFPFVLEKLTVEPHPAIRFTNLPTTTLDQPTDLF